MRLTCSPSSQWAWLNSCSTFSFSMLWYCRRVTGASAIKRVVLFLFVVVLVVCSASKSSVNSSSPGMSSSTPGSYSQSSKFYEMVVGVGGGGWGGEEERGWRGREREMEESMTVISQVDLDSLTRRSKDKSACLLLT